MSRSRTHSRLAVSMVGAGRLARALLPQIIAAGHDLRAVYARRPSVARSTLRAAQAQVGSPKPRSIRATTSLRRAVEGAHIVLLAVPDRAIKGVAERLADVDEWTGRFALHHAGSLGPEALAPLAKAGASVGVLHPLQCLGDPGLVPAVLPGSGARIEGHPAAVAAATTLAESLGLVPLRLPEKLSKAQRAAYHAAAALVSNDVIGLVSLATTLMERAGLPKDDTVGALVPLLQGTLAQLEAGGFAAALTGPAVRGDLDTLKGHLGQLSKTSQDGATIHHLLSVELVRRAQAAGLKLPAGLPRRVRQLK